MIRHADQKWIVTDFNLLWQIGVTKQSAKIRLIRAIRVPIFCCAEKMLEIDMLPSALTLQNPQQGSMHLCQ